VTAGNLADTLLAVFLIAAMLTGVWFLWRWRRR
jgi:hypothetical protein